MSIKERLLTESTTLGKILKTWVTYTLMACAALGAANEYLVLLPSDYVPTWIKTAVVIAGVISFVGGHLTVKKNELPVQ